MLEFEFFFILVFHWFVVWPFVTLLHEVGHVLPKLAFTRDEAWIELGSATASRSITLGRLTVVLRLATGFVGFYHLDAAARPRWLDVAIIIGGPLASMLIAISCMTLAGTLETIPESVRSFLSWCSIGAGIQFLVTAIPMRYPAWLGAYGGLASDGERLRQALQAQRSSA